MVVKAGKAKDIREARILLEETLDSGKALQVMKEWIVAQGGTAEEVEHPDLLPQALCQEHGLCGKEWICYEDPYRRDWKDLYAAWRSAEPKREIQSICRSDLYFGKK